MAPLLKNRFKNAWNAFMNRAPTRMYYGSSRRPDKIRRQIQNERSIVNMIYNRFSVDCSLIDIKHVRLDENYNYEDTIRDSLNDALNFRANADQTGRAMIQDAVYSMLDEGSVALLPIETEGNPEETDSYEVETIRVGKILEWSPYEIRAEAYNELTGRMEQLRVGKRYTPIIYNPFYEIMNEPNSTLQRFIRVLNQLDNMNDEICSGKIDLIVKLPYSVHSPARKKLANERRDDIEAQMTNSKYGIAYIDSTEQVIQLNRSLENNLWAQAKELKEDLFDQMGITMSILNGTADGNTMTNYYSRVIEPIMTALTEAIEVKWISKTARTQKQAIRFFRDPFKLIPVDRIGDVADKLRRNEIMSSNEIRSKIGLPPSKEARADILANPNLNHNNEEISTGNKDEEDILHYGTPRHSGRYPWGSGERPHQNSIQRKRISGEGYSYNIKDENQNIISEIKLYDYSSPGFNWVLMADVDTDQKHRGKGLATSLINKAYSDIKKEGKGLYLFVRDNNETAIKLYEKLNFDYIKDYKLDDGNYLIMAKGDQDKDSFHKMKFS